MAFCFILLAFSLPCASADFQHVCGKGRKNRVLALCTRATGLNLLYIFLRFPCVVMHRDSQGIICAAGMVANLQS
ncbi:hypothetical protein GDO81_020199 [Engystomops pustulosus]|uniref:Secreted protein n=1 Tax=Engystomops pustulosus TaxID=76066 RepID=A0AAV6YR38_ENGPU|nr:hypothetical protein GDO81_020199 [Engystomops pustulosus]